MAAVRAAVFDLDGTLCDTIPDIGGSFNRAFARVGLPTRPVREYAAFVGYGIAENLRRAAPEHTPQAVLEEALACYLADYPIHCADETAPYPGIPALLSALRGRGLALAVVTNKTDATARFLLSRLFPENPFALIWGRAQGRSLKPSRALGDALCEALSLSAQEILYVGDGDPDVAFAANCGFAGCAVTWGYRSPAELRAAGATRLISEPAQLLALL